mgnify:CR=1 FL=1
MYSKAPKTAAKSSIGYAARQHATGTARKRQRFTAAHAPQPDATMLQNPEKLPAATSACTALRSFTGSSIAELRYCCRENVIFCIGNCHNLRVGTAQVKRNQRSRQLSVYSQRQRSSTSRTAWTSAARRTKEAAMKSKSFSTPNWMSLTSFSVRAGRWICTPGDIDAFLSTEEARRSPRCSGCPGRRSPLPSAPPGRHQ